MKSPSLANRPEPAHERLRPSVALIDPKALTRGPIGELLAKAFPEYALVAVSTCEELLETEGIGSPNLRPGNRPRLYAGVNPPYSADRAARALGCA
jgi:hypothetical protein